MELTPPDVERSDPFVQAGAFGPKQPRRAGDIPAGLVKCLANAFALGRVSYLLEPVP